MKIFLRTAKENYYHRRHYHLASTELSHLLTGSRILTWFLLPLGLLLSSVICIIRHSVYILQTFFLHSCILSKTGFIFISFAISAFVLKGKFLELFMYPALSDRQ